MQTSGTQNLNNRGIAKTAISAGWTQVRFQNTDYYNYPVYGLVSNQILTYRLKALPGQTGAKYLWLQNKPASTLYYRHPAFDLISEVAKADGVLYLANGEPSVLAYVAAGLYNVISWFGEGSVPASLVDDLQSLGVKEVRYAADKDEAGRKSAAKVRDKLQGSGIVFQALDWGNAVAARGDANDLWISCEFDTVQFQQTLKLLSPLILPESVETPVRRFNASDFNHHQADLIASVSSRLGISGFRANGWSIRNIISPFRDEKHPSAAFNRQTGVLYDFGSGESYSLRVVAERLGIDCHLDFPQKQSQKPRSSAALKPAIPLIEPFNPPAKEIQYRWTSDLALEEIMPHRTLLLRAPMATGKTELVKRLINHLSSQPSERAVRILYINHLKSLTANAAARLNLEQYDAIPAEFLPSAAHIAISYNSLHKLRHADGSLPVYDLVVVDECEQVQPYIGASTFRPGEALRNYEMLRELCASAKQVLFMDAHAGQINADWLNKVRGDCQVIVNTWRPEHGIMTMYQTPAAVVEQALRLIDLNEGCVVIPTNSRKFSETLYHYLKEYYGNEAILLVNSENSESPAVQYITLHINEELPRLRALICSPSYSTGLDVTASVRGVCGIFFQQPTLPSDNLQMMGRYRNAQEHHVYMQACERHLITDADTLFKHELNQMLRTSQAAVFQQYNLALHPRQIEILKLQSRYEAYRNRQQQNSLAAFRQLAEHEGYILTDHEGRASKIAEQLKASREAVENQRKTHILVANPVTHDELKIHRLNGTINTEIRAGYERFLIEDTTGIDINSTLYDDFHKPSSRQALRRFTDLQVNRKHLQERDREQAQIQTLIRHRSHYTESHDLVTVLLRLIWNNDVLFNLSDFAEELTESTIEERCGEFIRANIGRIQRVIDYRYDLSIETLAVVRRILKSVGLFIAGRQVMIEHKRFYVYRLDELQLEKMQIYATARLNYLEKTITQNTREYTIESRVLRSKLSSTQLSDVFRPPDQCETLPAITPG